MAVSQANSATVPWLQNEGKTSGSSGAGTTKNNGNKSILGKDDFLKLLITELKYQNPLEPVKDKEFIAQMASFSSLEQMSNLNTGFEKLSNNISDNLMPAIMLQQSSQMVGRTVDYLHPDTEESAAGVVESVVIKGGIPYYVIDGKEIGMSNILKIGSPVNNNQQVMGEILDNLKILTGIFIPEEGEPDGE